MHLVERWRVPPVGSSDSTRANEGSCHADVRCECSPAISIELFHCRGARMLRELLARGGLDPNYPTVDGVTLLHELCHKDSRGRTMSHRGKPRGAT
jgi:hypothetical protein